MRPVMSVAHVRNAGLHAAPLPLQAFPSIHHTHPHYCPSFPPSLVLMHDHEEATAAAPLLLFHDEAPVSPAEPSIAGRSTSSIAAGAGQGEAEDTAKGDRSIDRSRVFWAPPPAPSFPMETPSAPAPGDGNSAPASSRVTFEDMLRSCDQSYYQMLGFPDAASYFEAKERVGTQIIPSPYGSIDRSTELQYLPFRHSFGSLVMQSFCD